MVCHFLTQWIYRPVLSNLFDTAGHLINFPPAGGPQSRGGHGERAEREPIRGVWGQSLQWGPGAEPLVAGSRGEAPLKLKHFLLPNVQWKPQIRPFFWNLETQKAIKHCWILQVDFIWLITRPKLQFMWDDGGPHGILAARGLDSTDIDKINFTQTHTKRISSFSMKLNNQHHILLHVALLHGSRIFRVSHEFVWILRPYAFLLAESMTAF